MFKFRPYLPCLALAGTILATVPSQATDGYFAHGVGAKSKGMAGAGVAIPQEAAAIATNPAAAMQLGHRLDVGADIFVPIRSARIEGNMAGSDRRYSGNAATPSSCLRSPMSARFRTEFRSASPHMAMAA